MTFAIALLGIRTKDDSLIDAKQACFLVEAFNKDEAQGIGQRLLDYTYPVSVWGMARHVLVSSLEIDPAKPFDQQFKVKVTT